MAELKSTYVNVTNTDSGRLARTISAQIYGSTARREAVINIHVKPGASHTSWKKGRQATQPSSRVLFWLINGTGYTAMGRPLFDEYRHQRYNNIKNIMKYSVENGRGKIIDRFADAGFQIKNDLVWWLASGGMSSYPNFGRYADEKSRRFGTPPCVATGSLMQDLEVTIE